MSLASLISEIDAEIARLEQAKQLLCGMPALQKRRGRPLKVTAPMVAPTPKRRTLSAAARAKIAAAQKARWARAKKSTGKSATVKAEATK